MEPTEPCPCGSGNTYIICCGRYIQGDQLAPTAEALMRSRYAAYTLQNESYLLKTWHQSTCPGALHLAQEKSIKWIGLQVLVTNAGTENDEKGEVEFVARYKINGKAEKIHEHSRFVREGGEWFYVDGDMK